MSVKQDKLFSFVQVFYVIEVVLKIHFVKCDVSETLAHVIDESIVTNLRNHPENRDDIFDAMEYFRDIVYEMLQIVLHHDRLRINYATLFYKLGKPRFLDERINTLRLSKLYEWNTAHFTQLKCLMSEITHLWENFIKHYELLNIIYGLITH